MKIETAEQTKKNMIRVASAMRNSCVKTLKNNCKGCPFSVMHGCHLYGHPYEWDDTIKAAKEA